MKNQNHKTKKFQCAGYFIYLKFGCFTQSMLEFTANGWIIKSTAKALEYQELLQQINVRIEVK
jgi:hypothetical protein